MTRTERVLRVAAVTATALGLFAAMVVMAITPENRAVPMYPVLTATAIGFGFGIVWCVALYALAADRKISAAAHTYRRQDATKRASGRAA